VTDEESQPLREYVGFIWTSPESEIRVRVQARSLREAKAAVAAEYGEGHVIVLWNEEDAAKPH
jgi:hypothetical protein